MGLSCRIRGASLLATGMVELLALLVALVQQVRMTLVVLERRTASGRREQRLEAAAPWAGEGLLAE